MGMYDTINGEQVKCFPWAHFYKGEITYSGGELAYYGKGDEVPYKKPYYNYGKNFLILDINEFPGYSYVDYDYVIHYILDGKVVDTYTNLVSDDIDFSKIENVVGYRGELFNIHSKNDILEYIKAKRKYQEDYEKLNSHWDELFKESSKYFTGLGLLDPESEEKKERIKKLNELHKLMDEEKSRIKDEIDKLVEGMQKWHIDTTAIDDLIMLGDYLYCITFMYDEEFKDRFKDDERKAVKEIIRALINNGENIIQRYIEWQGDDSIIQKYYEILNI